MTNHCVFTGRITKDLEIKQTDNGNTLLPFDIAVQRDYKNKEGEYDTDFVKCIAFRSTAEFLYKYAEKGYLIAVEGEMQNNNFTRDDGTTNYGMRLVVKKVDTSSLFLNRNEGQAKGNTGQAPQKKGQNNWQQKQQSQDSPFNDSIDISEDELPF